MAETMTADPTAITVTFDDLFVLSAGQVDTFVYDMAESVAPPPYYITVDDHRFALVGVTFLESGHGAVLPRWVAEQEAEGRLAMFVRRGERLLGYVFDPSVVEDDEAASDETD